MTIRVEVVPHDPEWLRAFTRESPRILAALGENAIAVHHIGSTAIPQIYAKPVIDMLVEVQDIGQVDDGTIAMEVLGYEAMGEFGIAGRRYFRKDNEQGIRTHHVHIFEVNSPNVKRHLTFRDYMIVHPEIARQYSDLKRELAKNLHWDDIEGYMDGKDKFIKEMEKRALRFCQ